MRITVGWFILCVFALISGCATYSTRPDVVKTIVTEPAPDAETIIVANFSLTGRISVQDEDQNFSAGIRWQHTEQEDDVVLLSPFGQVMAQIKSNRDYARLTTSEQKVFHAVDVETLTQDILGWRIPLTGLKFWVQGHHAPATVSIKAIDINDQVVSIRQNGWEINYIRYSSATAANVILPKVLVLNYDKLTLKLVVDSWEFD